MDWSQYSVSLMRLEARFGDRVVPAFCDRPKSIWAMVSEAASRNPHGEALVCGDRRMNWGEVVREAARIAAVLDGVAFKLGQTRDRADEGDLRVTQSG